MYNARRIFIASLLEHMGINCLEDIMQKKLDSNSKERRGKIK